MILNVDFVVSGALKYLTFAFGHVDSEYFLVSDTGDASMRKIYFVHVIETIDASMGKIILVQESKNPAVLVEVTQLVQLVLYLKVQAGLKF